VVAGTLFVRSGFGLVLPSLPLFVRMHHLPVPDLGLAAAAYTACGVVGMFALAPMTDRLGHVRGMMAGAIVYMAGSVLLLILPDAVGLLAGRALQGLAMALFGPASFAYVALTVPRERRGGAYGTLASAQMAGFILGPAAGGVALAMRGLSAPLFVSAVAAAASLVAVAQLPRPVSATVAAEPAPAGSLAALRAPLVAILAAPWGAALLAYSIGQQIPTGAYDTAWSLFLYHLGAAPWLVGASFAAWALPLVILSPVVGRRVRPARAALWMTAGAAVTSVAAITYALLHNPYLVAGLGLLEGAGSAASLPVSQMYLADRVPPTRMAGAQGVVSGVGQGAALLAAIAAGYLYPVRPWLPFVVAGVGCAAGTAWFFAQRAAHAGIDEDASAGAAV